MMSDDYIETDKDQELDLAGERGGDTGNTTQLGKGVQAEKGDRRRDTPVHSGPTRSGAQDTEHKRDSRSGSESNSNR